MIQSELIQLKKQTSWKSWYILISSIAILVFFISAFREPEQKFRISRARGIEIEDSSGSDHILIGSHGHYSKFRVRSDTNQLRKFLAKNFRDGNQYMQWYKNLLNSVEGMVVMNDNGFDREHLGDKNSDTNTGQLMVEPASKLRSDKEGRELCDAGVNTAKEVKSTSVIGGNDRDGEGYTSLLWMMEQKVW